jgi:hypothetical protein
VALSNYAAANFGLMTYDGGFLSFATPPPPHIGPFDFLSIQSLPLDLSGFLT